jgi:hypothetical protein
LQRYDENNEAHIRYRSPDISFCGASSSINQQIKYRSNIQLNDHRHQPKILRTQSRTHSSSSTELNQPAIFSPRSSNETSDDDDPRRKYLHNHQSIHEQQLPSTPTLRYASNGVLLRSKQQHSINTLQTSSNDMNKKFKRFSLDQQQQTFEPTIYRSSMAIISNHTAQINNTSLPFKQLRDESNNDLQRPKVRKKKSIEFFRKINFL